MAFFRYRCARSSRHFLAGCAKLPKICIRAVIKCTYKKHAAAVIFLICSRKAGTIHYAGWTLPCWCWKHYLKKTDKPNSGKSGLAGSETPARRDFRTQATIAHLDIQGFVQLAFTPHLRMKSCRLRKACDNRPFFRFFPQNLIDIGPAEFGNRPFQHAFCI